MATVKCSECGTVLSVDTSTTGYSIREIKFVVCSACESKIRVPDKTISIPATR